MGSKLRSGNSGNLKMAWSAIKGSKWRSLMTMFGIVIGIVSVVTTISLGEGVKKQIISQINHLGSDLITVRPGKTVTRDNSGKITSVNFLSGFGASTLTENDLKAVQETPNIKTAVPLNLITGVPEANGRDMGNSLIVATTENLPDILNQKVEFGSFFHKDENKAQVAVIGKKVAEQLFAENVPIGKSVKIRGQDFVVRGVFERFETTPLANGTDFNTAIFIPYEAGKQLTGGAVQIYQIMAKPSDPSQLQPTLALMREGLLSSHSGQEDFTILEQSESLAVTSGILNMVTGFIGGIAAISLLVGGIGIMNIMLVAVSERTHEIGIRKAIGATNRQILGQFLVEAVVLSALGGVFGVILSIFANYLLRILTDLKPVVTLPIIAAACGVSIIVGIVFGIAPALHAARKDPIEALRT